MLGPLDAYELAWAAGFFDGEGHTGVVIKGETNVHIQMAVQQVDPRPLIRFRKAVGMIGDIGGPTPRSGNQQPIYRWSAHQFESIQAVVAMLWRYLSEPKREQAAEVLQYVVPIKRVVQERRLKVAARKGHSLSKPKTQALLDKHFPRN